MQHVESSHQHLHSCQRGVIMHRTRGPW